MASPGRLTIVTLNTWKKDGDYARRLPLMARQLTALAPDIVVLQEVFAAPEAGAHTGDALAAALTMHQIHEAARPRWRRHGDGAVASTSGLSLLSRIPIKSHQRLELPADSDGERIAIAAWMEWNGGRIVIVNLHLTYQPDAHALRRRQLKDLVKGITGGAAADAIVLAGDFNAEPDSPPLNWLRESSGFSVSDAWDAAGGPRPTMREPPGGATIGAAAASTIFCCCSLPEGRQRCLLPQSACWTVWTRTPAFCPADHAGLRAVLSLVP